MDIVNRVLSLPRNIDFYIYTPGSGGEFFASLIPLSHKKTREVLKFKSFNAIKNNELLTRYDRPQYFTYDENFRFLNLNIDNEFYNSADVFAQVGHYMNSSDRINYCKMLLFQSMIGYNIQTGNSLLLKGNGPVKNISIYKDTNIILCTHWINFSAVRYLENWKYRNFGLKLFEKEKYWGTINLDPQTEKGINLVLNFCKKFELYKNSDIMTTQRINHKAFKDINLKFPFMDYMANNNLNSIKDYIENRYGADDRDFDFIDRALIDYKKIRIDPYL